MIPEALNPGYLYVFVFGPGFGEAIAVRVPPDRWLVMCYVVARFDEAGRGEMTICGPGTVRVTEAGVRMDV